MLRVILGETIDAECLGLDPLLVGQVPSGLGTPDYYVVVFQDDKPVLRVDIYQFGSEDCSAFQDAIVWRDNLVVGVGTNVHAVSLLDRSVTTTALESYYGHLYPTPDYLLVASGERLYRMEPDRSVLWTSELLAIDGVVVHEAGPVVVYGDAEWDPPGGWRPFALFAADGRPSPLRS